MVTQVASDVIEYREAVFGQSDLRVTSRIGWELAVAVGELQIIGVPNLVEEAEAAMTKRQEIRAARDRGLLSREDAEVVAPVRHRRTCPACAGTFLPLGVNYRGFCCGCCAGAWGRLYDAGTLERRISRGVQVVLIADGRLGTVLRVASATEAVAAFGRERLTVAPAEVERVQHLSVTHVCGKDRWPVFGAAKKGADDEPAD